MKRSALKRRTQLRRRAWMGGRKKRRNKYARRPRDTMRMRWVKSLSCLLASGLPPFGDLWRGDPPDHCRRAVEAHHAGRHGAGQKSDDDTVIPLCDHHHDALTDRRLCFSGWPPGSLKEWELAAVAWCQALYDGRDHADDVLF